MSEAIANARITRLRTEPKEGHVLDLQEGLGIFRDHFWKISLSVLAAGALAVLYLDHVHPVYSSSALLEVTAANRVGGPPTEVETAETLKTVELKLASQSVLLEVIRKNQLEHELIAGGRTMSVHDSNSAIVRWTGGKLVELLQMANAPGLAAKLGPVPADHSLAQAPPAAIPDSELVRRFATKLKVQVVRGSRLISLTVKDESPERAQHLAQAVVDEFFEQARSSRSRDSLGAQALLTSEVKRVGDEFRAAQEKLEAYRAKFNAVSLQERQNIVVERLRELNQQVAAAKNTRLAREAEVQQVNRLAKEAPEQLLSIRGIADLPEVIDLRKQLTLREADLATLGQRYGPLHPTMMQAKSELEELRTSLRATIQKATNRVRESYSSAKAMEVALEKSLAESEKAALELDRIAIPFNTLQREVEAHGAMYRKVLEDLNKSAVDRGLTSANDVNGIDIRIVERPLVPVQPSGPRRNLLLSLSLAVGLFVGCGLALGAHALDTSITSVDKAEAALGLPVLTSVPRSRRRHLDAKPLVMRDPASAQAEAFRSLRTALSLKGGDDARSVLFTSAVPDEGKSFCSLNCAAVFAQQGLRTLLIDADLRRPGLLQLFSDPNEKPGLTACMRDPELFAEAVQKTPIPGLYRLGDWAPEPGSAELVAGDRMREIVRRAVASFDRVVIDTAPLMAVSDTLYIARHVAVICLVVHGGKTPRRVARRALKLLEEVSKRPATGLVLNKVRSHSAAEYYYYYNT